QISGLDTVVALQTMLPPMQLVMPGPQTPCCPVLQACPPPGLPSSVWPLQSSSRPLQLSDEGDVFGTQERLPPEQVEVPTEQTPGWPVGQTKPPPGLFSSTWPSQSSSRPLQISLPLCPTWTHWMLPP